MTWFFVVEIYAIAQDVTPFEKDAQAWDVTLFWRRAPSSALCLAYYCILRFSLKIFIRLYFPEKDKRSNYVLNGTYNIKKEKIIFLNVHLRQPPFLSWPKASKTPVWAVSCEPLKTLWVNCGSIGTWNRNAGADLAQLNGNTLMSMSPKFHVCKKISIH